MRPVEISIAEDGTIQFLMSEGAEVLLDGDTVVRRASHVLPDSFFLRLCFRGLRFLFGEYGKMAAFTRTWPCAWTVDLSPVGGPMLDDVWYNREDAIEAEVDWLTQNFL